MDNPSPDLAARVLALEGQLRRAQALATIALLVAATAGVASWSGRDEPPAPAAPVAAEASMDLQVHRLTLVDGGGQARATLGVSPEGAVAFTLSAPDGSPRLALQATDQRAGVSALGPGGLNRAWLGWGWDEARGDRAELQLLDRRGQPRADLSASDAMPGLTLYNDAGVAVSSTPP